MKITMPIEHDSWNSFPQEELEFDIADDFVTIRIKGEREREIAILAKNFVLVAKILATLMKERQ